MCLENTEHQISEHQVFLRMYEVPGNTANELEADSECRLLSQRPLVKVQEVDPTKNQELIHLRMFRKLFLPIDFYIYFFPLNEQFLLSLSLPCD